jgi:hypothetical protein
VKEVVLLLQQQQLVGSLDPRSSSSRSSSSCLMQSQQLCYSSRTGCLLSSRSFSLHRPLLLQARVVAAT